jgi:biopolymer transport protein ExbB
MLKLLREKRYFILIGAIVIVTVFGGVSAAQEEGTATEQTMEAEETPRMSTAPMDSFMTAPNDSSEVAAGIAEIIRKERSGFVNRVKRSGIGKQYVAGGFFMHFLLTCSIIGLVFIIERGWTLSRARINVKALMMNVVKGLREGGPEAALEVCQRTRGPIAAILHSGLLRAARGPEAVEKAIETSGAIEMSFLERGLVALATIANVAPLLGFLGTVSGMISAFAAIAAAEQVSAKLVAKGIQEALITTAAGLIIAVPVTIAHSYFVSQIDRFIIEMEEASAELVDELLDIEYRKKRA